MLVCIRDEWEGWEDHGVLVKMISDNGYRLVGEAYSVTVSHFETPSIRFKLRRLKSQRRPLIEAVIFQNSENRELLTPSDNQIVSRKISQLDGKTSSVRSNAS